MDNVDSNIEKPEPVDPENVDWDEEWTPAEVLLRRWYVRTFLFLVGATIAGLLVTAATLTPASERMGTHQQLGLPPCGFVTMFGKPCPSCGMTTSWSHLMRGQIPASLQANPGGFLLGLMAIASAPFFMISGVMGKWLVRIDLRWILVVVTIVFVVTFGNWLFKLMIVQ